MPVTMREIAEEVVVEPRICLITLGVDDPERSLALYRDGLGVRR